MAEADDVVARAEAGAGAARASAAVIGPVAGAEVDAGVALGTAAPRAEGMVRIAAN